MWNNKCEIECSMWSWCISAFVSSLLLRHSRSSSLIITIPLDPVAMTYVAYDPFSVVPFPNLFAINAAQGTIYERLWRKVSRCLRRRRRFSWWCLQSPRKPSESMGTICCDAYAQAAFIRSVPPLCDISSSESKYPIYMHPDMWWLGLALFLVCIIEVSEERAWILTQYSLMHNPTLLIERRPEQHC